MTAVAAEAVRPQVSPLHDWHLAQGARMVTFAGWEMPVAYGSVKEEHAATRTSAGLFDVSHMGRLSFAGDAVRAAEAVFSRKVSDLRGGRCRYGFVTNDAGGVRDDVIVGREQDGGVNMVCNAANREKLLGHFADVLADRGIDCEVVDHTADTAMLAVQGPAVMEKIRELAPSDAGLDKLKRYGFARLDWLGLPAMVARSGYTGEDGVEITIPAEAALLAARALAEHGDWCRPCGLAARDTLRIEAGMPLYGHELAEEIDPLTASMPWAVDLGQDFVGAAALRDHTPTRKLVGLRLDGKRIARQGQPVMLGDGAVGEVTSGTFGPTVDASVAMAFVATDHAAAGTALAIDFRGKPVAAEVVALPFYKRG